MAKKPSRNKPASDPHADREARDYDNPIASREHILAQVAEQGAIDYRGLLKLLGIKGQARRDALRKRLRAMERDRQLDFDHASETYGLPSKADLLQGVIQAHRDGFGFVVLEGQEDLYLGEREMRAVFHGDEVLARPVGRSRRGGIEGKVEEVVRRAHSTLVGRLHRESGIDFVVPDHPRILHEILLERGQVMGAELGDYVSVNITEYPTQRKAARGEVVELLGEALAPGLETDIAIRTHGIPHQWPPEVTQEAARFGEQPGPEDCRHRVDLRDLPLVTIDGESARDYDDAVYCRKRSGGGFTLFVAIADVSHYVAPGSALDQEALARGTSVYFPSRVVPMLPESLSNGLCSLVPGVDRLAMVCELNVSRAGRVTEFSFYEAVIHSHARLTYTEVAEVLGLLTRPARPAVQKRLAGFTTDLENLYALYKKLRAARDKRGAIDFESTETQIVFNADQKIEAIEPVQRNEAHKLIEECMLCANVAAAQLLLEAKLPALYRVHLGPRAQKLENLRTYLGELGLGVGGGSEPEPAHYQQLLAQVEGRPDAHLIQVMLLRSMSQAVYQPDNQGHFGLAYPAYTHFTSPIRRYPDLLVHRAIRFLLRRKGSKSPQLRRVKGAKALVAEQAYNYDTAAAISLGEHCSMTERRADDATRDVEAWLKCEFLLEHIGQQFEGVIAGVTRFGVFVELNDIYIEGLLHINSLGDDFYHFDQAQQRLVGERSRRVYALGDAVSVQVARVDLDERKIDLELARPAGGGGGKRVRKKKKSKGKSKKKR